MRISDWSSDVCSSDLCCCSEEAAHRFESFVGHRRASCQGLSGEARHNHCGSPHTRPEELPSVEPCRTCARSNYQEEPRRFQPPNVRRKAGRSRSEEHTSELQSIIRSSYAVYGLTTQQPRQRDNTKDDT